MFICCICSHDMKSILPHVTGVANQMEAPAQKLQVAIEIPDLILTQHICKALVKGHSSPQISQGLGHIVRWNPSTNRMITLQNFLYPSNLKPSDALNRPSENVSCRRQRDDDNMPRTRSLSYCFALFEGNCA